MIGKQSLLLLIAGHVAAPVATLAKRRRCLLRRRYLAAHYGTHIGHLTIASYTAV